MHPLFILGIIAAIVAIVALTALIDQNGVPSKVNASTGTAAGPVVDPIITPQPLSDSFAGVVDKMLTGFTDKAVIVIDPHARRVVGTTDPTKAAALKSAVNAGTGKVVVINPDPDQEGKSLTWTGADGASVAAETNDALLAAFSAVKPKRSAASVVNLLVGMIGKPVGEDIILTDGAIIVVDQVAGSILVEVPATTGAREALSTALAAIEPGTTDMAAVALSEQTPAEQANPPVFEGGATS